MLCYHVFVRYLLFRSKLEELLPPIIHTYFHLQSTKCSFIILKCAFTLNNHQKGILLALYTQ